MSGRVYGAWAGHPDGEPEDKARCVKEVWSDVRGSWTPYQCTRKRGHGPGGLYCKQHADKAEKKLLADVLGGKA